MTETILERWKRLEDLMETAAATAALREAVHALEVIAAFPGEPGRNARTGIERVERALSTASTSSSKEEGGGGRDERIEQIACSVEASAGVLSMPHGAGHLEAVVADLMEQASALRTLPPAPSVPQQETREREALEALKACERALLIGIDWCSGRTDQQFAARTQMHTARGMALQALASAPPSRRAAMPDKPRLERVMLTICSACLDGAGGECHTPGCALWMNRAPDVQLRSKVEWSERSAKPAPVLQEETRHGRGSLGRHVVAKSAEVDAWPDERKPAYVRQEETGTQELVEALVQALRQAYTDLGCCLVAFEKMERGTDTTPLHCHVDDARRAQERAEWALRAWDRNTAASLPSGDGLTERAGEFLAPVNLRFGAENRAQAEALLSSVLDGQAVWLETPSDCDLPEAPSGVWAHVEADLPSGDGERGLSDDQIDWLEQAALLTDPADPSMKDGALRALAALRCAPAPPSGETGSLREQLQAEGEAASRASAALAAARPERFAGETGEGRELREWTLMAPLGTNGWLMRVISGPHIRSGAVRVREIPSEGARA